MKMFIVYFIPKTLYKMDKIESIGVSVNSNYALASKRLIVNAAEFKIRYHHNNKTALAREIDHDESISLFKVSRFE